MIFQVRGNEARTPHQQNLALSFAAVRPRRVCSAKCKILRPLPQGEREKREARSPQGEGWNSETPRRGPRWRLSLPPAKMRVRPAARPDRLGPHRLRSASEGTKRRMQPSNFAQSTSDNYASTENSMETTGNALLCSSPASQRCRHTNEFTRALTELSRKFGIAIVGGQLEALDLAWNGPDAEKWEQYAINEDNFLVRGFWNQHSTVGGQ